MENIKSFREWYFSTNNSEDKIVDFLSKYLIKDEMELAEQIRDISLEYQDNGCNFEFTIYFINKNSRYSLYKSKNSDEWILDKRTPHQIHDKLKYQTDNEILSDSFAQISVSGICISREDLNSFERTLRSHFSDIWDMDLNFYDHAFGLSSTFMLNFDLSISKIYSEYGSNPNHIWKRKSIR